MGPNIRTIVEFWLKKNGCDGLFNDDLYDACGCGLDDFMPCAGTENNPRPDCVPAYKHICPGPALAHSECYGRKGETCYRPTKEKCEGK